MKNRPETARTPPPGTDEDADKLSERALYRDPNLLIVFAVTLSAVLSVSSLTPAFPKIARALDVSPEAIGLLISAFTVPGVALTPVLGVLADRWGRKRVLVPSLILYAVAGGACGLVRDFGLLLGLRFLQGVGAASLGTLNVTIIGDLYTGRARTTAMGYNSSVLSLGTASWPAIGGALATIAWFYPFFLPLLALPVGLLVLFRLESPEPEGGERLGEYLSAVWESVRDPRAIALFAATTVTFILIFGPYLAFLPVLMDTRFGASSLAIGLVMSSVSVASGLSASQLGRVSRRVSEKTLVVAGYVGYVVVFALIPLADRLWLLLLPVLAFGLANGLAIPSVFTLLVGLAPERHRAAFMSVNGMVLRLGQTLGPLLAGGLVGAWGTEAAFFGGAILSAAMALAAAALIGGRPAGAPPAGAVPQAAVPGGAVPDAAVPGGAAWTVRERAADGGRAGRQERRAADGGRAGRREESE